MAQSILILLIILWSPFYLLTNCTKITQIEYTNKENSYELFINFGKYETVLNFEINLEIPFSFIVQDRFPNVYAPSLTFIKNISSPSNQESFTQYSSQIKFFQSNLLLNTFNFYYHKDFGNYSTLSLAHYFPEEDLSFIYQLYKNKIIDSKSFSFVKDENDLTFLNFGGLPEKYKNVKYKGKCKINNTIFWGCGIKNLNIKTENMSFSSSFYNNITTFQTNIKEIKVPLKVFDMFIENIFSNIHHEDKDICFKDKHKKMNCLCNKINKVIISIQFNLEGLFFIFEGKDLFISYGKICEFMIIPNLDYPQKWTFGTFFMQKFNLLFDYDNDEINFYSNEIRINADMKVIKMNDDSMITKYIIKICYFYLSLILLIQTFLLNLSKIYSLVSKNTFCK